MSTGRGHHHRHATNERASLEEAGSPSDVYSGPGGVVALPGGLASALDSEVLVLNRLYVAIRVISAKRAFSLLCRDIAEVIHIETGAAEGEAESSEAVAAAAATAGTYQTFDFDSWAELSALRKEFEPHKFEWVKTVRREIAVPRVIRLLGYDRLPAQIVKLNRRNLFARDRNLCQYCGRHFPTSELSIDHVTPRSQGGGDSWENLVCACVKCNARKGGRTPSEARMHLIRQPTKPKRNPLISIRLGQDRYASWKAFLDDAYWNVELK